MNTAWRSVILSEEFLDVMRSIRFHREGLVLLLMSSLERPTGAREVCTIMDIDEHTAADYLRILAEQRLVVRTQFRNGYMLAERGFHFLQDLRNVISTRQVKEYSGPGGNPDPRGASTDSAMPGPSRTVKFRQDHTPDGKDLRHASPQAAGEFSQHPAGRVARHDPRTVKNAAQPDVQNPQFGQNAQLPHVQNSQFGQNAQLPEAQNPQFAKNAQLHGNQNSQFAENPQLTGNQNPQFTEYPQLRSNQNPQFNENAQLPVNINDSDINLINHLNDLTDSEEYSLTGETPAKNQHFSKDKAHIAVWEEMFAAGINYNPRTRALVNQPYVTPEYVKGHRLKLELTGKKGPKYAGLLVTILESGEPAPRLNGNGHLADCECMDCERFRLLDSWSSWTER